MIYLTVEDNGTLDKYLFNDQLEDSVQDYVANQILKQYDNPDIIVDFDDNITLEDVS